MPGAWAWSAGWPAGWFAADLLEASAVYGWVQEVYCVNLGWTLLASSMGWYCYMGSWLLLGLDLGCSPPQPGL
jgi:hypothetical protein